MSDTLASLKSIEQIEREPEIDGTLMEDGLQ
jgi:hypothetical protein